MFWITSGLIQLFTVAILAVIVVIFFKIVAGMVGSDTSSRAFRIVIVTIVIAGCMVITLNLILGPLWLSNVNRWVAYTLSSVSTGIAYGTIRLAVTKVGNILIKTVGGVKFSLRAQQ